ncbi:MAG: helix-turn-helix domain-containing protein [Colwellia sp.]|nr:helix-turn-helix domain-containing protein [Colwellia sp.]
MEKIDALKLSTEAQQQIRNQAIRLRKSGSTYKEISEIACVHASTIAKWCQAYKSKGGTDVCLAWHTS